MQPRITVITLGVDDLDAALHFYRDGLGFPSEGIVGTEFEYGAVAFIALQPGLRLALWPRRSISHDTGLPQSPASSTEMTLGHNVTSKTEVDAIMVRARARGRGAHRQAGARNFLGRLFRLFSGPGRPSLGNRLEPAMVGVSRACQVIGRWNNPGPIVGLRPPHASLV